LEAINRGLAAVEDCLRRGDEATARTYLDELVGRQTSQQLPDVDVHVAKTLSKAAILARDTGLLDWSEQLHREACRRNRDDPVAANGLAEVLKARGELAEAEQQYRANIARWPNNEVAANGLADVLKARGELAEAEQQYRANIARWPNDEVAASGLADVLKARGELEAAEAQYRANMARWPNDEVARHGLANVLRKQRRHPEALQLLPDPLRPVTAQELYHLHLRGMILLELGRWQEAVDAFERGRNAAKVPTHQAAFRRGQVLTELSRRDFRAALRDLDDLPRDVPRLDIYRLHAVAGQRSETEARSLRSRLQAEIVRMDFTAKHALRTLEVAYCLDAASGLCEPDDEDYAAIIDAEIEMEQAA
jgi:tetratricopeptide (TPR) repeat protein